MSGAARELLLSSDVSASMPATGLLFYLLLSPLAAIALCVALSVSARVAAILRLSEPPRGGPLPVVAPKCVPARPLASGSFFCPPISCRPRKKCFPSQVLPAAAYHRRVAGRAEANCACPRRAFAMLGCLLPLRPAGRGLLAALALHLLRGPHRTLKLLSSKPVKYHVHTSSPGDRCGGAALRRCRS